MNKLARIIIDFARKTPIPTGSEIHQENISFDIDDLE